ncbi:MAG: tetratricopeptide repeat protein [Bacteroidaceae bacterium]|nr:tetratricopeptide repeat protein [Bacteroidaceae bacterium]
MRKITMLTVAVASAAALTSCSKMGALSPENFNVTPTPLEAIAGEVPATISATFPQKYMKKKAVVVATPVLKYNGGEIEGQGATYQGEKVPGNATTVQYKVGGTYTMRTTFPYTDAIQQSDLYMRFKATKGNKTYDIPDVKIGYGVIATSQLLAGCLESAKPALAPDAYQRVVRQKQEAQIKYLVNQANVRASELKTTSIKDFVNILKEINDNSETRQLQNIEVSAYASPEGSYDFNARLAEKRQDSSSDYVNQQLKKNNMNAEVDTKFTAEDWDGFQQLVSASNIQDKDVILRVLSMYSDPAEREQQIRNMSVVYDELAKGILPELRRARLIANYDVIGRSDEQIKEQFATDARALSVEEVLYGAALQSDNTQKKAWYEKAAQLFPNDDRAFNNLANLAYQSGDTQSAINYLQKAQSINANSAEVATNRALIALAQGNVAEAEALIAKGTGANSYSEVLGNINLAKGNYSAAAANLAGVNNNSALLAQILNKDYTAAEKTLANIENVDAYTSYLSAILGARQGNVANVVKGITTALQQKPELKSRIAKDLEFTKYASQIATLVR